LDILQARFYVHQRVIPLYLCRRDPQLKGLITLKDVFPPECYYRPDDDVEMGMEWDAEDSPEA
jgi:hypothetical protein